MAQLRVISHTRATVIPRITNNDAKTSCWGHTAAVKTLVRIGVAIAATLAGGFLLVPLPQVYGQARLPARLAEYVGRHAVLTAGLTAAQQQQLLAGQPVTQLLDADPTREVAVFGAVWIKAPVERVEKASGSSA
jgi:hypothetical protein